MTSCQVLGDQSYTVKGVIQFTRNLVSAFASLFASCPHANTNFDGFRQRCWDCGMTRTFAATNDPGPWYDGVGR